MRILITGAAGALGTAVVEAAYQLGHQVVTLDRHPCQGAPAQVRQVTVADLRDNVTTANAVAQAAALVGQFDALIHLAGAFEWIPVQQSTIEQWRTLYGANLESALNVIQAALPLMSEDGSIVCVGAAAAQSAGAGMAPYAASKSGVARLVEALAAELKPRRIRVNAVLPSIIDTPRNRADMPDADPSAWTTPAAIADALMFLTSPQARAVNGALLPVTNNA